MIQANLLKYTQNSNLKKLLLETGTEILCEASPLDTIWGIGLSTVTNDYLDMSNWKGKNYLGLVLMDIRAMLKFENMCINREVNNNEVH